MSYTLHVFEHFNYCIIYIGINNTRQIPFTLWVTGYKMMLLAFLLACDTILAFHLLEIALSYFFSQDLELEIF